MSDEQRGPRGATRAGGPTGDPDRPKGNPLTDALGPVAGFGVTFSTIFRKPVTTSYPDVKPPTQARFHGRHQLNRWPDGLEKCIGCELCAWACPADAIYVEGGQNTEDERYSPGERYGRVYQINYLRCIFCGLCIEACPTRALTMTTEYELAEDNRPATIYEKSQLLAPLQPGMVQPPHPMVEGATEKEYYRNEVTGSTEAQTAYVAARRQRPGQDRAGAADEATGDPTSPRPQDTPPAHAGAGAPS